MARFVLRFLATLSPVAAAAAIAGLLELGMLSGILLGSIAGIISGVISLRFTYKGQEE